MTAHLFSAPIPSSDEERLRTLYAYEILGLEVAPAGTSIRIGASREHGQIVLRVRDDGPGIPEKERERIFDTYRRGPGRSKRGSRGLGLSFSRIGTQAMGGHIACEDRPAAGGACFRLSLPPGSS